MWYRPYIVRMRSTCVSYVYLVRMCNDLYIISVPRVLIHSVNLHWRSHELTHAHAATWWQRSLAYETMATGGEDRAVDAGRGQTPTATFQVATPEPFTFSRPDEWPKWIRRFERFRIASGLVSRDEEAQVNTLIYSMMGDEADDVLRSFTLLDKDRKSYGTVKAKFDAHFIQRRNVIFERAKFNRRRQGYDETVDSFITALYALAEHCGYGSLHDEMIRDRIVVGIKSNSLSEKLQLDSTLTLEKAITQVRQTEAVKKQQPLLRGKPDTPVGAVNKGRGGPKAIRGGKQGSSTNRSNNREQQSPQVCSRCGRKPAHDKAHCPARDQICHKCHKQGHFQRMCRSPKNSGVGTLETDSTTGSDDEFLGAVTDKNDNSWTVELSLQGRPLKLHIDTGAEVTVITEQAWRDTGQPQLDPPDRTLRGPDSRAIKTLGKFVGNFQLSSHQVDTDCYVATELTRALLGRPAIQRLNLIKRIATVERTSELSPKDEFPTLFQGLGKMKGEYMIELRDDAEPYSLPAPRRVAVPLLNSVREELERMERNGVIAKVNKPTEWFAGMVVVPKPNSRVRICVDLTRLNQSVKRERHPLPAVDQTLAQLAGAKVFSKLNANSGFWQIPLAPESALLTTFIMPFGRYHFQRLPFGILSAPEHFQRRMSEALSGVPGTVYLMDDVLVHAPTREEHDKRLREVLQRLTDLGMTLNSDKCTFTQPCISFLGHTIDTQGIRPDPNKVSAILRFATPTSVSNVRRFLGMVNQLSKFSPNLAKMTQPMRELLVKTNQWVWGEPQQSSFTKVKEALAESPVLALYDPNLETILSADASSHGLGAVLLQRQKSGELQSMAYVARAMTPTERRYAQIEKEALAFTWACERLSDYLVGLQFHIETDHKPLVPLFSTKNLEELPLRVQRFKMRMMRFQFSISHVPGKTLVIADALSRAPLLTLSSQDKALQTEATSYVDFVIRYLPATEERIEEIRECQQSDDTCQQVAEYCRAGWPAKNTLSPELKQYFQVSAELSVENNLLLRGGRLVIPPPLRKTLLEKIHSGHQGITKCRELARQSIWWPGLSKQLEDLVLSCRECLKNQQQRPQPLNPTPLPKLPWQKVASDLIEWKQMVYLLVVDYYLRYIEIAKLTRSTTTEVVTHLKSIFARHGIPEVLISDNGPQYASREFSEFASDYEFRHITSSPYHPQGNGEAERAVGTIKSLLKKGGDPYQALLAYRSTPLKIGYSPSQLLMGRVLRTTVPTTREQRKPKIPNLKAIRDRDHKQKERQKKDFDSRHRAREWLPLLPGDQVWLPGREIEAEVLEEVSPQSYTVSSGEGTYRRNRRDLVRLRTSGTPEINEPSESIVQPTSDESNESLDESNESSDEMNEASAHQPAPRRSNRTSHPPERLDPSWG